MRLDRNLKTRVSALLRWSCPVALRMGQKPAAEAAQLYRELSEEETCEDPDDNERVSLYEPFLFGLHTAEVMWTFCDEAGDKQGSQAAPCTKQTTEHITTI